MKGSGTVVTGTLGAGTLRVGDELELGDRRVRVRGLQSLGSAYDEVRAVARVAVNLRGVDRSEVARGGALLTPGAWRSVGVIDARLTPTTPSHFSQLGDTLSREARPGAVRSGSGGELPSRLMLHVGSAAVPVRVRPLGNDLVRLQLDHALPLRAGDRALLRDPGARAV